MKSIASLFVVLGAKTEGFQKGLKDAEKAAVKASRSFERTFGPALTAITTGLQTVGLAAAAGFGALAASGLKANSQMEQYRTTLNTVMGDSQKAAETLNWVKDFAAKTPFEMPGLVESTVKLQALGMEAQKFLPAAADMAAVFASSGKTVQDAAEALTDAAVGEFERLKEFGIKLGAEDFKAGGKYAGMAYADAVLQEIKNKNYSGAADALSKTFTGRLSTLKDTLGQVIQKATAPIFERVSSGMGGLMEKIEELEKSGALQAFTDKLTAGMTTAWNVLEKVAGAVVTIGKGIADNWGVIGPVLAAVGAAFVALKAYAAALAVKLMAVRTAQLALNIAMGANPIGAVVLAIGALVAAGVLLYQNWDTVKAKIGGIWEGIKTTVSNAANAVIGFFQEWGPLLLAAITGPIGLIIYGIATHWDAIKAKTTEIWNGIKDVVVGAFSWMYDHNYYFQGLVDFIRGAWDNIKTFSSEVWNGIKDTLSGIWDAIRGAIVERWNAISTVTTEVWTTISGWLSGLWTQIQAQVTTAWTAVYGVISGIWTRIREGFDNLVKAAWDWGKNLMNNFINGFKSLFSRLWDSLKEAADAVAGFLGFHSPTKLGPGRDADKWAPNLVAMFTEGLKKSMPSLQLELGKMLSVPFSLPDVGRLDLPALAPPVVNVAPAPVLAGGGNVTNNYNITVHGHNYEEIMSKLNRELSRRGFKG